MGLWSIASFHFELLSLRFSVPYPSDRSIDKICFQGTFLFFRSAWLA